MVFRIVISNPGAQFKGNMQQLGQRINRAISATANILASMWQDAGRADIAAGGNFGAAWTDGLTVNVEGAAGNMRLYMTHAIPFASIFETGGVIQGSPLLWIPISGTDAEHIRAATFGDLFSARYPRITGRPLLFARSDKLPRYFGIEQVVIPKKWHLSDLAESVVLDNFQSVFDDQMGR